MTRVLCYFIVGCVMAMTMMMVGCSRPPERPRFKLGYETVSDRRQSLETLRQAWKFRPRDRDEESLMYARSLLYRAAFFGRRISETETYEAACDFWLVSAREHVEEFKDDRERFFPRPQPSKNTRAAAPFSIFAD